MHISARDLEMPATVSSEPNKRMGYRTGEEKDLENIMTVIHDAQRTMGEGGLDQWQDGYPSEEVILGDIRKGESRIWEEEGKILGTAMLSFRGESDYDRIYDGGRGFLCDDPSHCRIIYRQKTGNRRKTSESHGRRNQEKRFFCDPDGYTQRQCAHADLAGKPWFSPLRDHLPWKNRGNETGV